MQSIRPNFGKYAVLAALTVILLGLVALLSIAQDTRPGEPLSDEETLALLADRELNIYPLEAITESPPTIFDLTPTSARINWVGTIPTGCLLLYGETDAFGLASQDLNMNGAAIIEHNPLMLNLEPDTEYFFRMQGSDEAGNLYVSETFTLRTPPASEAQQSDNLLSPDNGAEIVDVSSNFGGQPNTGGTWSVGNAFDDNPNTAWSTASDGNDAFVEVALGQRSQINEISFWTRTMSNNTAQIFSFTITTETGEVFGPFELPDPDQAYDFEVDFEAESLRFDVVESNGGNTGAVEIVVLGEPIGQ